MVKIDETQLGKNCLVKKYRLRECATNFAIVMSRNEVSTLVNLNQDISERKLFQPYYDGQLKTKNY